MSLAAIRGVSAPMEIDVRTTMDEAKVMRDADAATSAMKNRDNPRSISRTG